MGQVLFVMIGWQALACYIDWVTGIGGIAAEFEACVRPLKDAPDVQALVACLEAYSEQLSAVTVDYYHCFDN